MSTPQNESPQPREYVCKGPMEWQMVQAAVLSSESPSHRWKADGGAKCHQ